MAYIKKLNGKYKVSINKKGFPRLAKRFLDLKSARLWAREIELQMEKNTFEDYSGGGTTLRKVLTKYRDEKTIRNNICNEEL